VIKEKDEERKKWFYHQVGDMGMSLVSVREDYDIIEKNNMILTEQNNFLTKDNFKIKHQF
jgi:hypothetical protein